MIVYLVRHGQSEANLDREVYLRTFDHNIALTAKGKYQAKRAGERLRKKLKDFSGVTFFHSPYLRAKQTFKEIYEKVSEINISINIYETPLVREQEWKLFDSISDSNRKINEMSHFGEFWYRFKSAESMADVYARATTFLNQLLVMRDKGFVHESDAICIVSHALFIKTFIGTSRMMPVKEISDIHIGNCTIHKIDLSS